MLSRTLLLCQVICLSLLLIGSADAATIVFDNFGPGDAYNISTGWTIENNAEIAASFIPTASGNVSDIWLAAGRIAGSNTLEVALMTDSGGQPGSVIETWTFNGVMGTFGNNNPLLHGIGAGTAHISAGVTYWLAASAPVAGGWDAWNLASPVDTGVIESSTSVGFGGPWSTVNDTNRPAFRVAIADPTVTTVPTLNEWGMIIFIMLAGVGSVYYLRRQKTTES